MTRAECDEAGLIFLRDNGPHTMEPINTEEELAAMLVFSGLVRDGLATSTCMTPGYVQFTITDAGVRKINAAPAPLPGDQDHD